MKLQHSLLAAALLAAASTSAYAQSSTGIVTLGGTIVPSTCTLTFESGDTADLGNIDYATLSATGATQQATVFVPLTIRCSGPTLTAWTITDNRHGSSIQANSFSLGLGQTSTLANFGRYVVVLTDPILDGVASNAIQSTNLSTWTNSGGATWDKTNTATGNRYKSLGTATGGPAPLTTASVNLAIVPYINSRNALRLTQNETINGNATIELQYL